jgi:regulator of replication initiation timing
LKLHQLKQVVSKLISYNHALPLELEFFYGQLRERTVRVFRKNKKAFRAKDKNAEGFLNL